MNNNNLQRNRYRRDNHKPYGFEQRRRFDQRNQYTSPVRKSTNTNRQNSQSANTQPETKENRQSVQARKNRLSVDNIMSIVANATDRDCAQTIYSYLVHPSGIPMSMFRAALTTKSVDPLDNMEMLELVGDSVVNCVSIAEVLRRERELIKEGGNVYRVMNEITSTEPLARAAKFIQLDRYIIATHVKSGKMSNVLEDAFEAFVGAMALLPTLKLFPKAEDTQIYKCTEKFVIGALENEIATQIAHVKDAFQRGIPLKDKYLKDSERATHILAKSRKHKIINNSLYTEGSATPIFACSSKEEIYRLILSNTHLFEGNGDSANVQKKPTRSFDNFEESQLDAERAQHVLQICNGYGNLSKELPTRFGQYLMRSAFTDDRIDPMQSTLNMFGDRLFKMYALLEYIPNRFPFVLNSNAAAEITNAISRLSQCRVTLARKLGLVRYVNVSDRAFEISSSVGAGSGNKNYVDVLSASFSSMISACIYILTDFYSDYIIDSTMKFLHECGAPLLDSVDFSTTMKSFSVGGKAALVDITSDPIRSDRVEYVPEDEMHRRAAVIKMNGLYGRGNNKAEAEDDLADKIIANIIGHPYRLSLDPGIGYPKTNAKFQLSAIE